MPLHIKHTGQRGITGLLLVLLVATGCASNPVDAPPPTIEPARAAVSPPAAVRPAGIVRPLSGQPQAALFDAGTSSLVVFGPGGGSQGGDERSREEHQSAAAVTVLAASGTSSRAIMLPGPATALAADNRGTAYLSARGGYYRIDLAAGATTRVDVDGQEATDFTAVALRADGKLVLGSADGVVYTLGSETGVAEQVKIFARVDSIVTQGNTAVVLDRGQTSVTTMDTSGGRAEQALRAGEGATTLAADPAGRILVADSRGDELLVFGTDPLIMRQRYPVPQSPYGLVGSTGLAWVSQTAANIVVGYDLATGIPVEKVRYPTVQQPNSLAFDDASGSLYVVSGSGAGVQVIERAAVPR